MRFGKDNSLGWHLHHAFSDSPRFKCFLNYYVRRFSLGAEVHVSNFGFDFSFSLLGTIGGYGIWPWVKLKLKNYDDEELT